MNQKIPTFLLVGIVLLLLVAPLSALAPLMLFVFLLVVASMGWTFIRTLVTGATDATHETDRAQASIHQTNGKPEQNNA